MVYKFSKSSGEDLNKAYRVAYLVSGFLRNRLSETEMDELDNWICENNDNLRLFERLTDENNLADSLEWLEQYNVDKNLEASRKKLTFKESNKRKVRWYIPAAAAALVILLAGAWWIISKQDAAPAKAGRKAEIPVDIAPGHYQAILELENGKKILLNRELGDTTIDAIVHARRNTGELLYDAQASVSTIATHRLVVPPKGTYKIVLPDGTRVWLNAASSLVYPTMFTTAERRIQLTGEGYFEVAKDASNPFRVMVNDMTVEALGTAFNINAYKDDTTLKTALIEGSVRVTTDKGSQLLKPGQLAVVENQLVRVTEFDSEEILAWKENKFVFRYTPLAEVMKQVERWYGAEVIFSDNVNFHLQANISRDYPVSRLIQLMEKTGHAHFRIEDNRIYISR